MKTIFFILIMVFAGSATFAVKPAGRSFVAIKIDGTSVKTGDVLTITNGQKLKIEVSLDGGRKDFCQFPATYFNPGEAPKILANGENGISYELNGKKSEWKLIGETIYFSGDNNIQINPQENKPLADLVISNQTFLQTFVKVVIKKSWLFSQDGINMREENVAEGVVYFTTPKSDQVWFQKSNVKASGRKDTLLRQKLLFVQEACDSIEHNMYDLNFQSIQQNIRKLQASVGEVKATIEAVKLNAPSSIIKVTFVGLPSDMPMNDIAPFAAIKSSWSTLESLLEEQKLAVERLGNDPATENKKELARQINIYSDWYSKLPAKMNELLAKYTPDIKEDNIKLPQNITLFGKEQPTPDYQKVLANFKEFLELRIKNVPDENRKISTVNTRIQAIRLFDGMLRSYFNSISWAEWLNTRE